MPWTTQKTWGAGTVVTASDLNTYLRDDSTFNFNGKAYTVLCDSTSGTTVTTSSTVWADVPGMGATVTLVTGRLRCNFGAAFTVNSVTNASLHLRLTCGGTQFAAITNQQLNIAHAAIALTGGTTGLPAGSYVIQLQWYMTAQTATMMANSDTYATMIIEEV